jgi:hypothetical protein
LTGFFRINRIDSLDQARMPGDLTLPTVQKNLRTRFVWRTVALFGGRDPSVNPVNPENPVNPV